MVGPFIFLDQMGPELLREGRGLDVAPHPHIGLATVTYLFAGELPRQSGQCSTNSSRRVNWMTAGRGIAHSERTPQRCEPLGLTSLAFSRGWRCPRSVGELGLRFSSRCE